MSSPKPPKRPRKSSPAKVAALPVPAAAVPPPPPAPRPVSLAELARPGNRPASAAIDLNDTPANAVIKLAAGHRQAAVALVVLVKAQGVHEPDAAFGPFTPLVLVERLGLRPEQIWHLFDQNARRDPLLMLALLHGLRLGLFPLAELTATGAVDRDNMLAAVRQHMPNLARS